MKKLKTLVTAAMMCIISVACFTSCSEKEDAPVEPAAKSVAGTYTGDMSCSVMGSESVFENVTFIIEAVDDAMVNVTVSSFGEPPMQVPELKVPGVEVAGSDANYSLAATDFSGTTESGRAYSGTLRGSMEKDEITIMFSLNYGSMPMPMICTFKATRN